MQHDQYQYLPVHWIDGMKINKSHFIAQHNACTAQIAQGLGGLLNEYNYGLLPNASNGNQGLKLFVNTDNQHQVQVRLQKCRAITFGGYVIQLDEDTPLNGGYISATIPNLSISFSELKGKASEFLVVLVINPYERVPYGYADPAEMPPRIPFTLPAYTLQLMPVEETAPYVLGNFQLPVGKLKLLEQKVVLDEDYIAPCSSVSSHGDLVDAHGALEHFFGQMELYALQIIQKVLQKKQQNEMGSIVQKVCEHITVFTATHQGNFKLVQLQQSPVFMINTVSAFARLIKNTLDFYTGSGKEELLNYCRDWCDVNQGELEGAITALTNHRYNHLNINDSIEKVSAFTKIIHRLFTNLSRLEYIGKRKDTGIFVKEERVQPNHVPFISESVAPVEPEPPVKKRKSFLVE
jgi:hypothetical protein